jgi:hypothetical protein
MDHVNKARSIERALLTWSIGHMTL